jgi:hypothetical protein
MRGAFTAQVVAAGLPEVTLEASDLELLRGRLGRRTRCGARPEDRSYDSGVEVEALAEQVRIALESADLTEFQDLLDPAVTWGAPDDERPSCSNRNQVLAWYRRGRNAGVRAHVTEVLASGSRILIGMDITGRDSPRWQVLTVRDGRIADIRGFESRAAAAACL